MNAHVRRVAPQDFLNFGLAESGRASCLDSAKKISLESWVVGFVLADLVLLAGLGVGPLWAGHRLLPNIFPSPFEGQLEAIALALIVFVASARITGLYRRTRIFSGRRVVGKVLLSLLLTFALLMAIGALSKTTQDYSRAWFFGWVGASAILLPALRMGALFWVRRALCRGHFVYKALSMSIGCEPIGAAAIRDTTSGLVTVGDVLTFNRLSELEALGPHVGRCGYDKIYIRGPWELMPDISQAVGGLRRLSADIYLVPELARLESDVASVQRLGNQVSLQISSRPIDGWNYWLKRLQDVTVATAALCILAPVLLVIALAIRLESRGPVLFRQRRSGFNGQTFELYKFRSMYGPHCDPDGVQQASKGDVRVTRVGRLLRRTSLDELPQLINVLQGRMSIVGPRPHALHTRAEGRELVEAVDDYAARHRVKPGMTGWAQIHGYRGELSSIDQLRKRVDYDLEYIRAWSLRLDARIILATLRSLLTDPNAY